VREVIEQEAFKGCRDSLMDYLKDRVREDRRHGYVQRVAMTLTGADENFWKDSSGETLKEGRTEILAAAFNELAAGDERGEYFREQPGGFGNLRSKVRYLVRTRLGQKRDEVDGRKSGRDPGKGRGKARAAGQRDPGSKDRGAFASERGD
jgi:hypothetical protein